MPAEHQLATEPHTDESHSFGYETAREDVQAHVPATARRILDLGCSTGALGAALKRRQGAVVVGVEPDRQYAAVAAQRLDLLVESDAETFLREPPAGQAPFDCLIAADVLEHLVDPWTALRQATRLLAEDATVVVSLPNVAHWGGLLRVVRSGSWPRDDAGPFDRTHLRWFTRDDAVALLRQAGIEPRAVEPRYWTTGWRLRVCELLAPTPVSRFMAVQYILSGGVADGLP